MPEEEISEQEAGHERGLRAARQKTSGKLSGKIKGGISAKVSGGLMKLIENKHRTTAFVLAFMLAIFSDFSDIATELLGFVIPVVNEIPDTIIDLVTGGALTLFFAQIGGGIRIKIWLVQLAATAFELIPFIMINDIFPTYTLGVIYAFYLVHKKAREAEAQLEEAGQGEVTGAMGQDMAEIEEEERFNNDKVKKMREEYKINTRSTELQQKVDRTLAETKIRTTNITSKPLQEDKNSRKNILNQVGVTKMGGDQANLNEIKKFTKEQFPEERKKVAEQLMAVRKEGRIEEFPSLAEKGVSDTKIIQRVLGVESFIKESKNKGAAELEDFVKIKETKEKVGIPIIQEVFEEEYDKAQNLTDEIEFARKQEDKLSRAQLILDRFYQEKSKAWTEYREDKRDRKVENLTIKNNAFVVHTINNSYISSSRLSNEVDASIRLKIILGLEPTLSTSSTKEDNGINSFLNSEGDEGDENIVNGIILKGGEVASAQSYDAWTTPVGLKRTSAGNASVEDINKEMQRVRKDYRYNELVVDSPKVAGYFITFKERKKVHKITDAKAIEEFKYIKQLGMPLYAIKGGAIFKADFDEVSGVYSCLDEKLSPEELMNNGFELSDEKKSEITKEVVDASVFDVGKLELEEADCFDSAVKGREAYILINSQKKENDFGEEYRPLESFWETKSAEATHLKFELGEEYLQISRVPGVGKDSYYGLKDNKLYNIKRDKRTGTISSYEVDEQRLKHDTVFALSRGEMYNIKESAYKDNESYFDAIKDVLPLIKENGNKEKIGKHFKEVAFNLYGYAAEAEKFGDKENAQKAKVLATELIPEEEYKKLITERSNERGNFKLNKEDLK